MNDKYIKTSRNAGVGFVFTAVSIAINAMLIPIIIKKYGVENWAVFAFFQVLVSVFTAVESSLQTFTQQKGATSATTGLSYNPFRDSGLVKFLLVLAFLFILCLFSFWILNLDKRSIFFSMGLIAFANVFPRAISSILKGLFLADVTQAKYYKVSTTLNILRPTVLLSSIIFFHSTPEQLAVVYLAFSFFETLLYFSVWRRPHSAGTEVATHKIDHNLLLNLMAANILSVFSTNLDKIAAYSGSSLLTAGNYNFAASIASLQFLFINVAISSFTPRFKELFLRSRGHEIGSSIRKIVIVNSIFIFSGTFFIFIIGRDLIALSGIKISIDEFMITFLLLSIAAFLNSNLWIPGAISNSCGKSYFNFLTNFISLASFLCSFFLLRAFDFSGAMLYGASMLISATISTCLGLYIFKKKIFPIDLRQTFFVPGFKSLLLMALTLLPALFWHAVLYKFISLLVGFFISIVITIKFISMKAKFNYHEEAN
ncbi:lipopolysaccharide biosynthesis protein [Chromobacterium violaceum]|uniref:lipopolysaccharide biosynthesis protein n=1 Tax=Chromobacterium violaceum TaxID=536 RepID=UPI0010546A16|nr:hypothetical protein [Chromobacterium violaceum]STB69115.1 Uncharacterised protein [Chromobacterium violaceum]